MILCTLEYNHRRAADEWDSDIAQTLASWFMSPRSPATTTFAQTGRIVAGLADELVDEAIEFSAHMDDGLPAARLLLLAELHILIGWVRSQGVDPL